MKKSFAKREFRRAAGKKWPWVICIAMAILIVSLIGFSSYFKQSQTSQLISSSFAQAKAWMIEHKTRFKQKAVKAKQLVTINKDDAESDIHFEFYNILPNMQVTISEPPAVNDEVIGNGNHEKIAKSVKTSKPTSIFSEDKIVQEMSAEYKKQIAKK